MIDLRTGELADILPDDFTRQPQVLAISYAIKQAYDAFLEKQDLILLYAFVDQAPEFVLDLMMHEMRVKYPGEELSSEVKRSLIKTAMLVSIKDGTNWAVKQMIDAIYGGGYVTEWYEYGGIPNHFRLDIIPEKTADWNLILNVLDTVKRKTARLDAIRVWYDLPQIIRVGYGSATVIKQENTMELINEPGYYINEDVYTLVTDSGDRLVTDSGDTFRDAPEIYTDEFGNMLLTEE